MRKQRLASYSHGHAPESKLSKETKNQVQKAKGDITSRTNPKDLVECGEKADASTLGRGLLSLPVDLLTEIFDYFPAI
jgi:hypothetical protein